MDLTLKIKKIVKVIGLKSDQNQYIGEMYLFFDMKIQINFFNSNNYEN